MIAGATDPTRLLHALNGRKSENSENLKVPIAYPVDALPELVRAFITQGAQARGIPPDFIAVPFLAFAGAAIGNRVILTVKTGWSERPNIWSATVGRPGTGKSSGADYARQPLDRLQERHWERYQQELAASEDATSGGMGARVRSVAKAPRLVSLYSTDATLEAVASILERSHGLALYRDELAGWAASFDQYRRGGDRQSWLGLWSGGPLKVDRKSSGSVFIPSPTVAVAGSVQPDRLRDLRGGDVDDGFADRLLFAWPQAAPIGWTDAEDDSESVAKVAAIFETLHNRWDGDPVQTRFSEPAGAMFKRFVNDNATATGQATGLVAGWSAKAPRHLARIAVILHCLTNADEPTHPVSEATLDSAIEILEYHRHHFAAVLPAMGTFGSGRAAGDAGRVLRRLRQAPARNQWLARSELMNKTRLDAARLTDALDALEAAGEAERRMVETETRPREEWRATAHNDAGIPSDYSEYSADSGRKSENSEFSEGSYREDEPGDVTTWTG